MIGQRFTRLTVIGEAPRVRGKRRWHCSCSCGGAATSYQWSLVAGRTRSCGCLRVEQLGKLQADSRHGMCGAEEHKIWKLMKRRCYDCKYRGFRKYGGSGIKVCDRWRESFTEFYKDMGPQPSPYHTIERFDQTGDFCPSNCRWLKARSRKSMTRSSADYQVLSW